VGEEGRGGGVNEEGENGGKGRRGVGWWKSGVEVR